MRPTLDPPTPQVRDQMRRARRSDTGPEVALRRILFAEGLRYRTNFAPVAGIRTKADMVFLRTKVAVYVDGCFWHGCPIHATWPKNNAEFWRAKINTNIQRDARVTAALTGAGWTVLRLWEHETSTEMARRVRDAVAERVRVLPRPATWVDNGKSSRQEE